MNNPWTKSIYAAIRLERGATRGHVIADECADSLASAVTKAERNNQLPGWAQQSPIVGYSRFRMVEEELSVPDRAHLAHMTAAEDYGS